MQISGSQVTFMDFKRSVDLAHKMKLNTFSGRENSTVAYDELSAKKLVRIKEKCRKDIDTIDKFIHDHKMNEGDWIAVRVLLISRENMIYRANRALMDYNISLNNERG